MADGGAVREQATESSSCPAAAHARRDGESGATLLSAAVRGGIAETLDSAGRERVALALQRTAGNATVAALLGRRPHRLQRQAAAAPAPAPAPAATTPADLKSLADLDTMTLNALDGYARVQADWSTSPSLTSGVRRQLWTLLEWARGHPSAMSGCGDMRVSHLRVPVAVAANRRKLETYSQGVEAQGDVINVPAVTDVAKAIRWGDTMHRLQLAMTPAVAKKGIKQEAQGADELTGQVEDISARRLVDNLTAYYRRVRPFWESEYDTRAYLRLKVDPIRFAGSVPDVRNYHRFETELLLAARDNRRDRTRRRPLSLVLHTSHDHNGAFMQDANLTKVFQRATHLTLLIEGVASLSAIEGRLPALARTYGRNRKITEAMVAGHGGSRSLELAGVPGTASAHTESLDLDRNAAPTERFFNALLDNMDNSPDARLVLNACLTASNEVNRPLDPANPGQARTDIKDAIAANPSLATRVRAMAAGKGVEVRGASGSFSAEAGLLDSSGRLDIASGWDPQLTNPDKFEYVRHGQDPEGAMRAVVECWADNPAQTLTFMEERRDELAGAHELYATVIHHFFDLILSTPANRANARLMNQLADVATPMDHLSDADESTPGMWAGADTITRRMPAAHMPRLFPPIETAATAEGNAAARLVLHLARASADDTKVGQFLATAGTYSCRDLDKYVAHSLLTGGISMANLLAGPGNDAGRNRLAIVAVRKGWPGNADAKTHLQTVLGVNRTFPAASGVGAALSGYWNESGLLEAIDRAPANLVVPPAPGLGPVPAGPEPNIDLDRDGVNDFYVVPATEHGGVTARALNVRERPGLGAAIAGALPAGARVDIIGRSGEWLAIDHRRRPRFVHSRYVRIGATP